MPVVETLIQKYQNCIDECNRLHASVRGIF